MAGVAYGATIMPLKVLSAQGSGSMGGIAQAIRWAADHGANVINMSLGGPCADGHLAKAIKYAHDKGVVVVARRRQRRPRPGQLPGALPGRPRRRGHPARRDDDLLFELGPGGRHRRAGRQHARRPTATASGGVLQHTIVPGDTKQHRLPLVHGDLDGLAARGRRGRAGRGRGRDEARRGRGDPARDRRASPAGATPTAGARVDDHYGAGIVDAAAALHKARDGRGGEELGLGLAAGLLGLALMRRRGIAVGKLGLGALAAFVVGASGLDLHLGRPAVLVARARGRRACCRPATPISRPVRSAPRWSTAPPRRSLLTLLLYGVRRLRPALAGFGFGVAGALLFAAIAHTVDLRFIPDALEPDLAGRPGGDRRPVRDGLPRKA